MIVSHAHAGGLIEIMVGSTVLYVDGQKQEGCVSTPVQIPRAETFLSLE